jgi:hypothetical protein
VWRDKSQALNKRLHAQGREVNKLFLLPLLPLKQEACRPVASLKTVKLYSENPKGRKESPAVERRIILKCI